MDWHSSVYGSRNGDGSYRSYGDDADYGTPFGARDYDDYGEPYTRPSTRPGAINPSLNGGKPNYGIALVDDATLRKRGGKSYFRAHEVVTSNRMHHFTYSVDDPNISLSALVTASDIYASDDYRVTVTVNEDEGDIVESHCTCPAFGRYGSVCKHVIALIMAFDELRDDFIRVAGDPASATATLRAPRRTSRSLSAFMRQRDKRMDADAKNRQLDLLKEIGSIADAGGTVGGGTAGAVRHMPIGSVSLRLSVQFDDAAGGDAKLRIQVPSRNLSYTVKDINGLLLAVRCQEFVSYGKKLAFIHTRDAFDARSQAILDVLDRARTIRNAINDGYDPYYYRKSDAARMRLSDGEIADLFDAYVGSGDTVEYTPSARYFAPATNARVVDGDPALGLSVVRSAQHGESDGSRDRDADPADGSIPGIAPDGYLIRHTQCVERFIAGQHETYVICRPLSQAVLAQDAMAAAQTSEGSGTSEGKTIIDILRGYGHRSSATPESAATIYRCDSRFAANRDLLTLLCGDDERASLYLSAADVDTFARTILPLLIDGQSAADSDTDVTADANADAGADADGSGLDTAPDGISADGRADGTPERHSPAGKLIATLPPELLRLVRVPCRIAIYLDRDRSGVTCDVQAHYGDKQYHVFDGIGTTTDDLLRDKTAERLAAEAVLHYFPRPSGALAVIPDDDDEAIYRLLTEGMPVLHGIGDVYATPAFDGLSSMPRPTIKVGLSVKSGLVEISPIADEIDPDDVAALLAAYRKRRRFHRLRNGRFVDMRDVDTSAVEEIASDLGLKAAELEAGGVTVPTFEAYYLDHQVDDAGKDDSFRAYLDDLRVIDPMRYRVPESLEHVLRPYQAEGFRWLNAVCDKGFGGILADEMGLGKTVQLLSFLLARLDEARDARQPSLIVCPASLVYNWAAEAAKFTPGLRVETVAGTKASRRAMLNDIRSAQTADGESAAVTVPDLLITSYDLLRRDIDDYAGLSFFCMTLDEAQYIKNAATKVSKAVRSITAMHRFALTGTPIENRLSELWSIIDFLMPGILGSYAHFRERFEMPILSGDESAQAKLQAFVGPFILRRLKSQVLKDLPEKIENVITVQLAGEQRKLYAALEQQLRSTILKQRPADFNTGKIQILAQLTKLRQVCCDPRLLYENVGRADAGHAGKSGVVGKSGAVGKSDVAGKSDKVSSAKLDAIAELVDSCRDAGRKMLIFSQFTSYLDLIAQRLRSNGIPYDTITGATPKKRRLELVEQFNTDATPVFLISLKAGNTGLNLTGACVVVHADPWWNAAAQNQATDRAHRIGQTQDVNVYQIVAKDTIEERIVNLQRAKTDLADRFVNAASTASGQSIAALTKDDLLALLG